jgi:hypothetical protein
MTAKLYPGEQFFAIGSTRSLYVRTGEKRPPKQGEYYLSGAIPAAYRALHDLNDPYFIVRLATPDETTCRCCGQRLPWERQ